MTLYAPPLHSLSMAFTFIETLTLAFPVLFLGRVLVARIPWLRENNIPAAIAGGLMASLLVSAFVQSGLMVITFDESVKDVLMLSFFATVGLGASYKLLLQGGSHIPLFLLIATGLLVMQNSVGIVLAWLMDVHPAVGLIGGSVTLSGGHGTGLAWSALFEETYGLQGAKEISLAAATFGLVAGGLLGGPVAQRLIQRHGLKPTTEKTGDTRDSPQSVTSMFFTSREMMPSPGIQGFLVHMFVILLCVLFAGWMDTWMEGTDSALTIPTFVWVIMAGIIIRNSCDIAHIPVLELPILDIIARVSLGLFLASAIMALNVGELVHLALPMLVILAGQVVMMAVYAQVITYRVMGRVMATHYDAAVVAGGHCGFGLGATPTAVSNMGALSERYGASQQAFLIVPLVGAFFIDILNVAVIQSFLSLPFFP